MAELIFENTGIKGLSAAVPVRKIVNKEFTKYFPADTVKEVVEKTGVFERRWAVETTTSSDLCHAAADDLLNKLNIDRQKIGALIFISQTPDYRMPATSITLQHRLGLSKSAMAFDINLGCSGFVYGLSVAYSLIQQDTFKYVLLLDGETRTKQYSFKDRTTGFIFGDGGVAALIEKDVKYGKSYFALGSDGSNAELIKIDAGGYRNSSSIETVKETVVDEYGNIRTSEQGHMNGADVFNFVIKEVPENVKEVLRMAGVEKETMDYFVFHQANSFMNNYLVKKLKLDPKKVPASISKFGNTSSVSIPLTIVSELNHELLGTKKILLSGFGVGMSWASAILNFSDCLIPKIIEVD